MSSTLIVITTVCFNDLVSVLCRCFVPAAVNRVTRVRFPIGPIHCRPPLTHQVSWNKPRPLAAAHLHHGSSSLCFILCQVSGRKWAGSATGSSDSWPSSSSNTTEEGGGDPGPDGGSGETKRARLDGSVRIYYRRHADESENSFKFWLSINLLSNCDD